MDVSSGWTTIVLSVATTLPGAVTTLSIGISAAAAVQATNRLATVQITPRAARCCRTSSNTAEGE